MRVVVVGGGPAGCAYAVTAAHAGHSVVLLDDGRLKLAVERVLGHEVVMQYFAQDEATRLDPTLTVYETLAAGSPACLPACPSLVLSLLYGFNKF